MRNNRDINYTQKSIILILNFIILAALMVCFITPVQALTGNPIVTSTSPEDQKERVDINLPIYITFDRDMDDSTMTGSNIVVKDSKGQSVPARGIHYDPTSKTTVFIPQTSLKQDESYEITILTGIKDTTGLPLLANYVSSFKTTLSSDTPQPLVIDTIPKESISQVGTKRVVSAQFNHDMDPKSINTATFTMVDQNNNPVTAKSITYDESSRIAAFVPASKLITNTKYTVTIKGAPDGSGVKDSAGVNLNQNYVWAFTTGNTEFYDPHGIYMINSNACATCHQTHNALNTSLINKTTETALCFTCHDGTGSNINISSGMLSSSNNQSFHPIMDTGNPQAKQLFQCSDCHNPHGDADAFGNTYEKLLRVNDGTNTVYQGNEFCLACHGKTDRKFTDTYYNNSAGDHHDSIAAHYDTTNSILDSVTKITCTKCHTSHSGKYTQLTDQLEENLCLSCHNNQANSHSGQGNIQEQFFGSSTVTIISKHDITSSTEGKVECTSCHGSHTVGAASLSEGKAYSDLSDPQNTKNVFTTVAGTPNATIGNMTDFCLRCHGDNPPTAARSAIQVVPFSIIFPQTTFINSGWNKTNYQSSIHFSNGISCNQCHEPHGSSNPRLQSRPEDNSTTSTSGECLSCHSNDIGPSFNQTSHHPTLEIVGQHQDTETVSSKLSTNNRHAECVDCHDPHSVTSGALTVKQGNDLCLDCHTQSTKGSGFTKEAGGDNLHLTKPEHNINCSDCHVKTPHGSPNPKLLSTTSIDSNSKIVSINSGSTNSWTKESCGTVTECHN
ncbi:cytochrome c3 family protein [Desulfitobacterium sp.]|uniref:cytochrome c3 family protein n=1 Tax=Desulfitobacterium sp. TaxID=49981 RepID=UPI002B1F5D93|nr:cytochrome c3 family protein [Desulfitobacterium sp.]MEA4901128.1 cytochrome c3 family protein [Desulfitobacterium sp.]